jgi:hypothetical protein
LSIYEYKKIYIKFSLKKLDFREVSKWLSVAFAARVLLSDTTYPTPTVRQTEPGSLTFVRLRQ